MEIYSTSNEDALIARAAGVAKQLGKSWDSDLERILRFCSRDPANRFPSRGKKKVLTLQDLDDPYLVAYVGRYYREREGVVVLQPVATMKDPAVDEVLKAFEQVRAEDLESIAEAHRRSMRAENKIGELLERYVARMLRGKNWIWCCGQTVRFVDFIKDQDDGKTRLLQIKNRSNSENSASSSVRRGTEIEKWYRTSSTTGKTRWEMLQENVNADGNLICTEKGFYEFVKAEASRKPTVEIIPLEEADAL